MKIINLLNKIANGEEVPKYIRYRDISKHEYNIMMVCKENIIYQLDQCIIDLNDEVEIIEEKETKPSEEEIKAYEEQFNIVWNSIKSVLGGILESLIKLDEQEVAKKVLKKENNKIEKLEIVNNGSSNSYALLNEYGTKCGLTKHSRIMCDKINELIDVINELRGGKNDN